MPGKCLVVIPDPIESIRVKGLDRGLGSYFNPAGFFDKVYLISPMEPGRKSLDGFEIIPAKDVQLPVLLRELKADVVRAYGGKWPMEMAVFFRAQGIPAVVSIHDRRPELLYPSIRWADIVLCVSEQSRQLVLRYHPDPSRVWLRPNGVDLDRMKKLLPDQYASLKHRYGFEKVVLHIGRKSPEKNIELLIRALRYLPSGVGLVMIGPGDDQSLRYLAEETGVLSRCVFIETVQNSDLPAYYSWADCFCLPSFDEAMSNVALEAMACGCPSVFSTASAAGVGVQDDREALVLDHGQDASGLAEAIMRVLSDEALAQRLVKEAGLAVKKFDVKITSRMEADQYQKILQMQADGLLARSPWDHAARKIDHCKIRLERKCVRMFSLGKGAYV